MLSTDNTPRDSVAIAIENHLRTLEANEWCEFEVTEGGDGFHLRFGESTAHAEDYDIALIRLASVLLNASEFSGALMAALRRHMPHSASLC
jgi:hypothetical protein